MRSKLFTQNTKTIPNAIESMKNISVGAISVLSALASYAAPLAPAKPPVVPSALTSRASWQPRPHLRWQVQYEGQLAFNIEADVYALDLFDSPTAAIAALKKRGKRLVCYLNAGAWEKWRPDAASFPSAVLGKAMDGWPGERWLDIRRMDVLQPIMAARLDLCRDRGFDGVIFDNVNSYINPTGFPLAPADQLRYSAWLGNEARARGLAAGMNNNSEQARELEPYFDWAQAESCFKEGWCKDFKPFTDAKKPVLAIEYLPSRYNLKTLCMKAAALEVTVILKRRNLDAFRRDCHRRRA